ncbi:alpha/beta hydrolase [Ancylobacter defluvii]|uniref:Esterase n=1 Tax=Ancylobacter defluvii TaxID=1282440 RepID=A0A9W6NAZ2_9HYPH|nr:alpha/beta hydrolase [Ancylobacter defluvii]MBS7588799.1 alpha/beta hydrolase [Ancylobacter defluvii]GLK84087.1 esterase [Ancylobacter defluvii]
MILLSKSLVFAVLGLTLAACAGPPDGVLLPVAGTTADTSQVDMVVATTRMPSDNPGNMYTGERGRPTLSFARITVSIPPETARKVGDVQWPKRVPGNPQTDFVTTRAEMINRDQALTWFSQRLKQTPKRRVMVFIHGFNNRFDDAVFRFAQIVHDSGAPVVPILFTWPSRGSLLAYGYDRESTNYSRDALERLLSYLAADPEVGEITVLAHSMGNWLTVEALRQMAIRNKRIAPKIQNVILAAPDVDVDVFRTQVYDMGSPRPNITVFVSRDDRALSLSRRVWGSTDRLGAIDPDKEPYKTEFERDNITVVDLTKLRTGDPLNHGKFAESPEVVQLIGQRLAEGQSINDSRVGLGDHIIEASAGAAAAVGTAAGVIVAAPVAVIDAKTRENYDEHLKNLGQNISGNSEEQKSLAPPPAPE